MSTSVPPGQLQLFGAPAVTDDWDENQRQQAQQDLLGVSLGISPLEQIADEIQSSGAITTLEAQDRVGERVHPGRDAPKPCGGCAPKVLVK